MISSLSSSFQFYILADLPFVEIATLAAASELSTSPASSTEVLKSTKIGFFPAAQHKVTNWEGRGSALELLLETRGQLPHHLVRCIW